MINIKEILEKEGLVRKFQGVAPDGFVLIHEDSLQDLKDIDTWIEWKMDRLTIDELNKKNFDKNG